MRLVAVDQAALALGLEPGLPLADARARVPELLAFDTEPRADAALLDWLAEACDRYTPMVAAAPPHGLILDITGCSHPFTDADRGLGGLVKGYRVVVVEVRIARRRLVVRMAEQPHDYGQRFLVPRGMAGEGVA
jgi:protein ImuB